MKKYIIVIAIVISFITTTYGQDNQQRQGQDTSRDFSLKEQLSKLRASQEVAPSVAETEIPEDPEIHSKPARASLSSGIEVPEALSVEKLMNERKETSVQTPKHLPHTQLQNNTSDRQQQPEGERPEQVPQYREMKGENNQPGGEKPENTINYRKMNGENVQPDPKPLHDRR